MINEESGLMNKIIIIYSSFYKLKENSSERKNKQKEEKI